ncbi:2-hydroxy-3-oxopropionate reductase [Treponema sp. Marseille-Q4132]|uniref:2-hydroxy-3-oxopropionate reductase n=1 Tax=Treponema sp. Marseille-Q4132 TaxID=2766701 RepID=UPI001652DBBC|nr:2-hydroxy-3-oxopropionate reductase [Treponema sp. Marseille-Q4132]QNL96105.1 2-hydroxy-3-oxopropionate reductase [Treponema sp. Marseille-Q4132]
MKIGFIGLGIMGKPMVKNLLKAGHEVVAYDIVAENLQTAVRDGAVAGKNAAAIAAECPVVITMLPNSPHVKAVVMEKDGVLEGAKAGLILIDMSSIAPLASKEICEACKKKGVRMLDAPVSGGEPKAIDGSLSIMVGGDKALFEEMKPILSCMGASIVLCGDVGAGNTTKLANQMIVAGNIAVLAEALTLAKKAGVDPETVFQAIKGGLAGSTVMNAKAPMMIEGNFKPGFRIDLHIKDLNNALETGHKVGAPMLLTANVQEMFEILHADGCGSDDHSGLAKYYAKISGSKIGK